MAHLDFKITSWKRLRVPDEKVNEVIERLRWSSDDDEVYELTDIDGVYFVCDGPDVECEEIMTPDENNGSSTQELYNSEGDIIYQNGTDY